MVFVWESREKVNIVWDLGELEELEEDATPRTWKYKKEARAWSYALLGKT